jgi:hypothetical protein
MSWIAATIHCNITGIREVESSGDWAKGLRLQNLEELEFAAVGLLSSGRRKNEERSKQFIENLSETTSQKSEKSRFE